MRIYSKAGGQVLHRRAAEVLRDRFADTATAEPEALAYHFAALQRRPAGGGAHFEGIGRLGHVGL